MRKIARGTGLVLALGGFATPVAAQWGQQQTAGQPQQQPGQQQPAQQQPQGYGQPAKSPMSAGGLAPPSSSENSGSAETEQQLRKADEEDSGRGLEIIWLNVEGGYEMIDLQTFSANDLVDSELVKTSASGPVYGVGAGLRLVFITVGARFRLADTPDYQLWTLGAELGIHIPLGSFEPYFVLGAGYASLGSFDQSNIGSSINTEGVDITGYNVRIGGGFDIYLSPVLSIGASLTGEMLFMSRPGTNVSAAASAGSGGTTTAAGAEAEAEQLYALDGSSVGSAVAATGVLGLHF